MKQSFVGPWLIIGDVNECRELGDKFGEKSIILKVWRSLMIGVMRERWRKLEQMGLFTLGLTRILPTPYCGSWTVL